MLDSYGLIQRAVCVRITWAEYHGLIQGMSVLDSYGLIQRVVRVRFLQVDPEGCRC